MGNYDLIGQREIQDMSVGSRIHHSEYNASDSAEAPVLQIWIEPGKTELRRSTQKFVRDVVKPGKLGLLAALEGRSGALTMHADALLYMGILFNNQEIEHPLEVKKHVWVQIVSGELLLNGTK
jgi:Pirin-related protein